MSVSDEVSRAATEVLQMESEKSVAIDLWVNTVLGPLLICRRQGKPFTFSRKQARSPPPPPPDLLVFITTRCFWLKRLFLNFTSMSVWLIYVHMYCLHVLC